MLYERYLHSHCLLQLQDPELGNELEIKRKVSEYGMVEFFPDRAKQVTNDYESRQ